VKYYLVAGERSGDLHGGNLIQSLKTVDNQADFRGFGGDHMEKLGMHLTMHYKHLAFMGFLEVLKNIRKISGYLNQCKKDIIKYDPDVVVLIDYGGFNLKMASFLHKRGIKVYYYITPKVWAWNQGRANKIKRLVDKMFVILPFEKLFYQKFDWDVDYVGNPVLDAIKKHTLEKLEINNNGKDIVAVLPGSRFQEITQVLRGINELIKSLPEVHFVIAAVDNIDDSVYAQVRDYDNVQLMYNKTYDLLAISKAAIVTSGTATLETALWKVPQVVIYKTSGISYQIAKHLIRVNYISLVNLIVDKPLVKELIQNDFNHTNLSQEVKALITDDNYRTEMIKGYNEIEQLLDIGSASNNTANLIVKYLKEDSAKSSA
jgi:lipid-A-disaccharide synthase